MPIKLPISLKTFAYWPKGYFKCFDEEALAASKSANPPISTCVYSPSSS
jgi:hypothetical protein